LRWFSLVAFLAKAPPGARLIDFLTLLSITIPSTFFGVLMIGAFSWFRGKDLDHDAAFQKLISTEEGRQTVYGETATLLDPTLTRQQWIALALLLVSKLVNSQAAAISAMVPVGLAIGVPPGYVVAFAAACYGYCILPTYPSDVATIQFDRSGTTHIGKYVINHSFILPGLIGVVSSCVAGYLLAVARGLV
jgi:anaerobic C4-dicarboxylate transporter